MGQKVFARDERTGRTVIAKVEQVLRRRSDHLIAVGFAASKGGAVVETLKTTRQHPFYVDGKGWVPAGGLAVGNAIVTRAGPRLFVKSVTWHRCPQGYTVFNFEVGPLGAKGSGGAGGKFTHSYFVGSAGGGVWVHNANYSRASRSHIWDSNHAANSPVVPGKSRFLPTEGAQKFTNEVIDHPGVIERVQGNGRIRYDVPNMGRQVGIDSSRNPLSGGRVVVEGSPPAFPDSPYAPGDVVTQFLQR